MGLAGNSATFMRRAKRSLHQFLALALSVSTLSAISVVSAPSAQAATAGSGNCVQTYTASSGSSSVTVNEANGFCYVAFKNTGAVDTQASISWTRPTGLSAADVLVIGGGGGGGARHAGGGGAGGYVEAEKYSLTTSTVSIVVGAGGKAATGETTSPAVYQGTSGKTSSFSNPSNSAHGLTALGGGFGSYNATAGSGGSGGGSGAGQTAGSATSQAQTTLGNASLTGISFGFPGRAGADEQQSSVDYWAGGGGGGAGARGQNPKRISTDAELTTFPQSIASDTRAGAGGIGKSPSWLPTTVATSLEVGQNSGSSVYFAGGGGGGMGNDGFDGGAGGLGGGGNGTKAQKTGGIPGTAFTGGGGGSSGFDDISVNTAVDLANPPGGAGGSGVVLLRYQIQPSAPTITGITGGNGSLSVAFTAASQAGETVTGYKFSTDGGSTWSASTGTTTSPISISGLTNGTSYQVQIRAVSAYWDGVATSTTNAIAGTTCSPTTDPSPPAGYTILTFTTTTTCNWSVPSGVTKVDVLVVGGGGAGGAGIGGGGGAGQVFENLNVTVTGSISVTVGAGGAGGTGVGGVGANSVFGSTTAFGGGGGGNNLTAPTTASKGSGGGGGYGTSGASIVADSPGKASAGGSGNYTASNGISCESAAAGGGGGATSAGGNGTGTAAQSVGSGGAGGAGFQSTITGLFYGGGGGGGLNGLSPCIPTTGAAGAGGNGGGGAGAPKDGSTARAGINGTAGTGGGGGGSSNGILGGNGGSGVVVVKYLSSYTVTYSYNSADAGNSTTSSTFNVGGSAITLPTPTRTGFAFAGWYTASTGGSLIGAGGASYSPTGTNPAISIHAQWSAPSGTINVPSAPDAVSAVGSNGGISVNWAQPVSLAGKTITNYQVEYSTTGAAGAWTIASSTVASNATSYSITGLTANTSYYVRVVALFSGGRGAYGYPWQKIYGTITPTRSSDAIVYETGFGTTAGDAFSRFSSFTRVRYLMKATYGGNQNFADVDFAKGLQNASSSNSSGFTLDSVSNIRIPSKVSGQQFVTQGDVYDLTVLSPSTVTVQNGFGFNGRVEIWPWNYDVAAPSGVSARSSNLYDDSDTSGGNGEYGSFQLHNITNGSSDYRQTVFAWNRHLINTIPEIGFGNHSGTHSDWTFCTESGSCGSRTNFSFEVFVNAPITASSTSDAPTAVTATRGNTQASVSWSAPASNGGSAITGYTVTSSPSVTAPAGCTNTSNLSCTFTGLTNGTAYTFTVVAINGVGSSNSSSASASVIPATVPGAPTGLTVTASSKRASISWSAPVSNGGSAVTGYSVTSSPSVTAPAGCINTASTSCVFTGLAAGTPYTFTIIAINAIGNSVSSTASSSVTPFDDCVVTPTSSGGFSTVTVTTTGTCGWIVPSGISSAQVLVVGGGGGGGYYGNGGGGGGGGVLYTSSYPVTEGQVITVTVGAGGAGVLTSGGGTGGGPGSNGGNSSFGEATATGGGGGAGGDVNNNGGRALPLQENGLTGGSGGGGSSNNGVSTNGGTKNVAVPVNNVNNWTAYGNNGAGGASNGGGGGGGAGSLGGGPLTTGDGRTRNLGGTGVTLLGVTVGAGGRAGGIGSVGAANTGNGGGASARGGTGVVIVRYAMPILTPAFGTPTPTSNGFTVQISNFNSGYTWSGTSTVGTVSINGTGLVTVTGVGASTSSTATITNTTASYTGASATVSATSSSGSALNPSFGTPTATADGFTVSITNYDAAFTWETATVTSGLITINSTSGSTRVLAVTGLSPGSSATITQNTTRAGYANGTATVIGTATSGTALTPTFGTVTPTSNGFTVSITNYDALFNWNALTVSSGTVTVTSTSGSNRLLTVTGLSLGSSATITQQTSRTGYVSGSSTVSGTASTTVTSLNIGGVTAPVRGATPVSAVTAATGYTGTVTWAAGGTPLVGNFAAGTVYTATITLTATAGYTFSGVSANSFTVSGATATNLINSGVITAVFPATIASITYSAGTSGLGTAPTSPTTVAIGGTFTTPFSLYTRAGYSFGGWKDASNNTYAANTTYPLSGTVTGNVVLTAQWTGVTYTVLFAYNGRTGGDSDASKEFTTGGTAMTLPTPTRTGYTFGSWYSNVALTTLVGSAGANYEPVANLTLYAKWNAVDYTVTYNSTNVVGGSTINSSSGTVPTDSANYNIGQNVSVKSNSGSLARTGYTFAGWVTSPDGTGTAVNSGQTIEMGSQSINLYPKWSANTYTITYNLNGGTGDTTSAPVSWTVGNSDVSLPTTGITRNGYTFGNGSGGYWSSTQGGAAVANTYSNIGNVTLYAIWTVKTIAYSFSKGAADPQTIANFPSNSSNTFGSSLTLPNLAGTTVTISSNAHLFSGWSYNNTVYRSSESFVLSETEPTFTAIWTRLYDVKYAFAGGTKASSDVETDAGDSECVTSGLCTPNQPITLRGTPTRTGYQFGGWKVQDGSTIKSAGSAVTITDSAYLFYAQWTAIDYEFSFNSTGGSNSFVNETKNIGQLLTLPDPGFKTGYSFAGWSADSGTTKLAKGSTYVVGSSSQAFVAYWTPNIYTIVFDWQGATGSTSPNANYTVGTGNLSLPTIENRVKDGYNFAGWSETSTATTVLSNYQPTTNKVLYAIWSDGNYALTLNGNGATVASEVIAVPRNSSHTLPTRTRANFKFVGWFDSATGGNFIGNATDSYLVPASQTLYARWVQDSFYGVDEATLETASTFTASDSTGVDSTITHTPSGSSARVQIQAGALTSGTVISVRYFKETSRQQTLIGSDKSYFFSILVSWIFGSGSTATVPNTAAGKPILVTLSNSAIRAGAMVYRVIGGVATELQRATVDGSITVELTSDPELVIAAIKPTTPMNVTATSAGIGSSNVSWLVPTSNGGSEIIEYTASVATDSSKSCTTSTLTCTITGLSNGTNYNFVVTATNGVGTSPASTPANAATGSLYTVTFDSKSGTLVSNGSFYTASTVSEPSAPTRSGYSFAGWSATDGGSAVTFPYAPGVTNDITLYARWDALNYVVTFDSKSGSSVSSGSFAAGGSVSAPTVPTRSGYTFAGWSATDGGSAVSFPYSPGVITGITLYANWTAAISSGGGGSSSSNSSTPAPSEPSIPSTPVKSNVTTVTPVTVVGNKNAKVIAIDIQPSSTEAGAKPVLLKVDGASEKFIAEVKVVEGKLVLTPETGFSGKKTVTVTITENGVDRIVQIPLTVLPEAVAKPIITPTASNKSIIRWTESPNATTYTVLLNGKRVCSTSASSCSIAKVLGPDSAIEIISNGGDRTVSEKIEADFRQSVPVTITRLVSATITKASLTSVDIKALDKVIALIKSQGFGTVVISEITTTSKTKALAAARIESIKKYITSMIGVEEVVFEVTPVKSRTYFNNISVKG